MEVEEEVGEGSGTMRSEVGSCKNGLIWARERHREGAGVFRLGGMWENEVGKYAPRKGLRPSECEEVGK